MESTNRIAIYPGTFDPLTFGHVSLIKQGLNVFDTIIVAVAASTPKTPLFTLEERVGMARSYFQENNQENVKVEAFEGLLVDYVKSRGASVILRGLRAVSDFEYEFQMALMNRQLDQSIQTVFLMTKYRWLYISSTIIKDAAKAGGDVSNLVPEKVYQGLRKKYGLS